MKKIINTLFVLGPFFYIHAQENLLDTYNPFSKHELSADVYVFDEPAGARRLFRSNKKIANQYLNYVNNQSPSWYLKYFNVNSLRRHGWDSHWQLYNNRFLIWQDLFNNSQIWIGEKWNIPIALDDLFIDLNTPQIDPRLAIYRKNWIQNQEVASFRAHMEQNQEVPLESNNENFNSNSASQREQYDNGLDGLINLFQQNNIEIKVVDDANGAKELNHIQKNNAREKQDSRKSSYNVVPKRNLAPTAFDRKGTKNNSRSNDTYMPFSNSGRFNNTVTRVSVNTTASSGSGGNSGVTSGGSSKSSSGKEQ